MKSKHMRLHKTKLKCFINPILRKIQFWTDKPYVIASIFDKELNFIKFNIKRVQYSKTIDPNIEVIELHVDNPWIKTFKNIWR